MLNPFDVRVYYRLAVRTRDQWRRERIPGWRTPTYNHQLRAFADAVLQGRPILTPPADSVATLRLIDDVYRAAGLKPRAGDG